MQSNSGEKTIAELLEAGRSGTDRQAQLAEKKDVLVAIRLLIDLSNLVERTEFEFWQEYMGFLQNELDQGYYTRIKSLGHKQHEPILASLNKLNSQSKKIQCSPTTTIDCFEHRWDCLRPPSTSKIYSIYQNIISINYFAGENCLCVVVTDRNLLNVVKESCAEKDAPRWLNKVSKFKKIIKEGRKQGFEVILISTDGSDAKKVAEELGINPKLACNCSGEGSFARIFQELTTALEDIRLSKEKNPVKHITLTGVSPSPAATQEEGIQAAVDWWEQAVQEDIDLYRSNLNEFSRENGLTGKIVAASEKGKLPRKRQVDLFKEKLTSYLRKAMEEEDVITLPAADPNGIVAQAMKDARINGCYAPHDATMTVSADSVVVHRPNLPDEIVYRQENPESRGAMQPMPLISGDTSKIPSVVGAALEAARAGGGDDNGVPQIDIERK